jgi:hypothetical protein
MKVYRTISIRLTANASQSFDADRYLSLVSAGGAVALSLYGTPTSLNAFTEKQVIGDREGGPLGKLIVTNLTAGTIVVVMVTSDRRMSWMDVTGSTVFLSGLGQALSAASLSVVMASDALGAKAKAASMSVTVATDEGATPFHRVSTADNNAAVIKAGAGTLQEITCNNVNAAARYLKLYNLAVAPNPAADTPVRVVPLSPNSASQSVSFGPRGLRFTVGIAMALVTGIADNDNTAVAADQHVVGASYI